MSTLLRSIDGDSWNFKFNPRVPFPSDPLGDLKTTDGNLSVFEISDNEDNLEEVIVGLICTGGKFEDFQYVLLDTSELQGLSLEVKDDEIGETKIPSVDAKHRNISINTADNLLELAKYIASRLEGNSGIRSTTLLKPIIRRYARDGIIQRKNLRGSVKELIPA